VLAAVARIRERAQGVSSPDALGALAVTYLVAGDAASAVKTLESATAQDPTSARLQSDLAAAYFVRASQADEPADLPKALEAAETAITLERPPVEAWFNRALALERLHLVDAARKAWDDYLARDSTSGWADEARQRRDALPPARQSTLEDDRARARAAIAEGGEAVDRLADEAPQVLRDYFESVLLAEWARAEIAGDASAATLRAHALRVGDAVLRTTGDALARDTALALAAAPAPAGRDPPRSQARGFEALHEAQRLYELGLGSCPLFRESLRLLRAGGSPYAAAARERVVVSCLYSVGDPSVLPELLAIESDAERRRYGWLVGRAQWMTALVHVSAGRHDAAVRHYRRAGEVFRALRDAEGVASIAVRLAFALAMSGDSRAAWRAQLQALAGLHEVRQPTRREDVLFGLAFLAWESRFDRCAAHALGALVELLQERDAIDRRALTLARRAEVLHRLGRPEQAAADLTAARSILAGAVDMPWADNVAAFADAAEGRMRVSSRPGEALELFRGAMSYFEPALPAFVPALRVDVARALLALGREVEAEAELEAAMSQVESQARLGDARQQALFFDYAAAAPFDAMAALQLDARHDARRALESVERSRAQPLAAAAASGRAPLPLATIEMRLPAGVALVYYAVLPGRIAAWVVDRGGSQAFRLMAAPDEVERSAAGYAFAIESEAPQAALRETAGQLFDALVRPLLPALEGHETLVLVPDAFLRSLPFASLWNRDSTRYLVEDFRLVRSPSGSLFVRASAAAARMGSPGAPRLLAVGNPRLPAGSGFQALPGAQEEATAIARLYPGPELLLNGEATKPAFLAGLLRSDVVHFAGHAAQGESYGSGRLLLAPGPGTAEAGVLRADEIVPGRLARTRLVVLAGCRTAAGEPARFDGVRGMARPFLAAGVPMVVGSLWDVDDATSRAFFLEFHARLLALGDAAAAIRDTQLAFLRGPDPALAHPSRWAGYVSLGGLVPARSRAPRSRAPL